MHSMLSLLRKFIPFTILLSGLVVNESKGASISPLTGNQIFLPILLQTTPPAALLWPIDCVPGKTCSGSLGYPDIDGDGQAFNCQKPGYRGHQGTDIRISWSRMNGGVDVYAAEDGQVIWVFDGKYDRCPDPGHPDCKAPPPGWAEPGESNGYRVCTEVGDYCGTGTCCCFWCFDGGNVVVIRHSGKTRVFATRYDHLKKHSVLVSPGDFVAKGQKIAEAGSSGNSSEPHLHFEVWGNGFYELDDPWAGPCGPNFDRPLWESDPPWGAGYSLFDNSSGCMPLPRFITGQN
jgi:murein DD-endopeptidase MepM/ murein hydrolase activator NlpD